ncbi:MAG: hypothetical protein KBH73_06000 [Syntrophobacterales bacterium]|nr:hypothetical protein [Syntrophobacterales bacterium]
MEVRRRGSHIVCRRKKETQPGPSRCPTIKRS